MAQFPQSWLIGLLPTLCLLRASEAPANPITAAEPASSLPPPPLAQPAESLRDMEALYDSPYTVNPGHFQVESYVVSYTYDHDTAEGADSKTESWSYFYTNLRLGLLHNLNAELILAPYNTVRTRDRITQETSYQSGFGDIIARLRYNLWGNDDGKTALALLPFLKIPSSQDDLGSKYWEGGLILPFAAELPAGFVLGLTPDLNAVHGSESPNYHFEFANTAYLWRGIIGNLSGYIEFYNQFTTEKGTSWIGAFDLGLAYLWNKNLQFDLGVCLGVTDAADDFTQFIGVSYRF